MRNLLLYSCLIFIASRCAQITPLTGGKKDTTAPKPLSFKPENFSLDFQSKIIEIDFDEYIVLKDIQNQFIITPQTKEVPIVEAVGKKLKITFNELLLPNTTYKLSFGNTIYDVNESNLLTNFEYVFSTGKNIDSLKVEGRVLNAYNLKPEPQTLVGLYAKSSNDSVVYNEKPLYITKTNENGDFKFDYLPNTLYKIVAIKDENKNLLYDGSEEQIAFHNELLETKKAEAVDLMLFKEIPSKSFIKKNSSIELGKALIIFNKSQDDIKDMIANGLVTYNFNSQKDSLTIYYENKYDTLETYINYHHKKADTVYVNIPSKNNILKRKATLKYVLNSNLNSELPYYTLPTFQLNFPIQSEWIDSTMIELNEKVNETWNKLSFSVLKDKGLITTFKIKANFKSDINYQLKFKKGALNNKIDRENDSLVYLFATTDAENYAKLNLTMYFPKKENYMVLLLNEKGVVVEKRYVEFSLNSTSEKKIEFDNLIAGNYFVKVVEDVNKNRDFDTGDLLFRKQPERVYFNKVPIKLLSGWEILNEWIIK